MGPVACYVQSVLQNGVPFAINKLYFNMAALENYLCGFF